MPPEDDYNDQEDEYVYEEGDNYYEGAYERRRKPKFGEPLDMEDGTGNGERWGRRGVWEGEWEKDVRVVE